MKKKIFYFFLLSSNLLYAQDDSGNRSFSRFLNSSATIMKTVIDDHGYQTILALASGTIIINNKTISLSHTTLILLRHQIKDSTNFLYTFLSDPAVNYSNTNVSDICKTRKGFVFGVNFSGSNLYFAISLYPIYPLKPTTAYNCAFIEFDTLLNIVGATKFGSDFNFSITKLASDSNDNICALLSSIGNITINDTLRIAGTGSTSYTIINFKGKTLNWQKPFVCNSSSALSPLQLLSLNNEFYALLLTYEQNINYEGHLLSRTSQRSYVLLNVNSNGEYMHEIESDSVNTFSSGSNILVGGNKVFLNLPYVTYLKVGNTVLNGPLTNVTQSVFELDTSLNVLSLLKLNAINGANIVLKAYSNYNKLLYFELSSTITNYLNRIWINDSIYFITDWRNYQANTNYSNLFSYSTINKSIVSSYEISPVVIAAGYSVYCSDNNNPEVYCQYYNRSNFKSEGQTLVNSNQLIEYSFSLKKPVRCIAHPTGFKTRRTAKNCTILNWDNRDIYDSLVVQKFSTYTGVVENTFTIKPNNDSFADLSLSSKYNYIYKIRGYGSGEYSIWIACDSTSTTDSLLLDRHLIAGTLDNTSVALSWGLDLTPSRNIYTREVYRSENRDKDFIKITEIKPRIFNNYIDTALNSNKAYYYFVRDFNYMYDVHTDTAEVNPGKSVSLYSNTLVVFPNPCSDRINFYLSDPSAKTVTVYDAKGGTMLLPVSENNGKYFSDVAALADGIYTITFIQYGILFTRRIIKL